MRCNNCGWDNQANSSVCIKCNTPLEVERKKVQPGNNTFGKTITDRDYTPPERIGQKYTKTVDDIPEKAVTETDDEKDMMAPCPNPLCDYINPVDALFCAKCKLPVSAGNVGKTTKVHLEKPGEETIYTQTPTASQSYKGTINPYRANKQLPPICSLTLVLKEGEKPFTADTLIEDTQTKEFVFEDQPIQLNRNNLEKDNNTITSKVQAELFFENGHWYLQDKSELQSTFILVKGKIELKEDDVLLIGDRKFIFSTNSIHEA